MTRRWFIKCIAGAAAACVLPSLPPAHKTLINQNLLPSGDALIPLGTSDKVWVNLITWDSLGDHSGIQRVEMEAGELYEITLAVERFTDDQKKAICPILS